MASKTQAHPPADPSAPSDVKSNQELISADASDDYLASMAGEGNELVTSNDVVVPLIRVLQDTSKVVKRTDPAYIPGMVPGTFFNTLTRRSYGETMTFIDCFFHPIMSEWRPNMGGLVGFYELNDPRVATIKTREVDGRRRDYFPDSGNDANPVNQHYVMALDPETGMFEPAIFPLGSTQLRKSRQLNATLGAQKLMVDGKPRLSAHGQPLMLPRFATKVVASLRPESNDSGSWFGVEFTLIGRAQRYEIDQAKAFKDMVMKGSVKGNLNDLDEAGHAPANASAARAPADQNVGDDEIPF